MLKNRSVPADTILPHLVYEDVAAALGWLERVFGFAEHFRYGDRGCRTQSLTVFVEDIDAHYQRARSAGAKIVEEIHETEYGERQYGAEDTEGHHWLFSKHVRDVSPEEWGAALSGH